MPFCRIVDEIGFILYGRLVWLLNRVDEPDGAKKPEMEIHI